MYVCISMGECEGLECLSMEAAIIIHTENKAYVKKGVVAGVCVCVCVCSCKTMDGQGNTQGVEGKIMPESPLCVYACGCVDEGW